MSADRLPPSPGRVSLWSGRILSLLVVLFLLLDAVMKIALVDVVVSESVKVGIPEQAIQGIGVTLLAATLLYAAPPTMMLGAILLTGYLGGAIFAHVRLGGPWFPVAFAASLGVLVWLAAALREPWLWRVVPLRFAR